MTNLHKLLPAAAVVLGWPAIAGDHAQHLEYRITEHLLSIPRPPGAGEFEAAIRLLKPGKKHDGPMGVEKLEASAALGFPPAIYQLSIRKLRGEDTPVDVARGLLLLQQAATQGYPPALLTLGRAFEEGNGLPRLPWLALTLYQVARKAGLREAGEPSSRLQKQLNAEAPGPDRPMVDLESLTLARPMPPEDLPPSVGSIKATGLLVLEIEVDVDGSIRSTSTVFGNRELEPIAKAVIPACRFKPLQSPRGPLAFRTYWALRRSQVDVTEATVTQETLSVRPR